MWQTEEALQKLTCSAKTPRYLEPASVRQLRDVRLKRIKALPSDEQTIAEDSRLDYLPVSRRSQTKDEEAEPEPQSDLVLIRDLTAPFLSAKQDADVSSDEEFSLGADEAGQSIAASMALRNAELDKQARENPTSIENWITFVNFQDEAFLALSADSSRQSLSRAERTSVAEVKMSILERAMAVNDNEGSSELLLAYLKAAEYVWEPAKLLKKWKETLEQFPSNTELWIKYVEWRQCAWDGFKVDACAQVYEECLGVLRRAASRADEDAVEQNMVYLFLRYALMLRQAGGSM